MAPPADLKDARHSDNSAFVLKLTTTTATLGELIVGSEYLHPGSATVNSISCLELVQDNIFQRRLIYGFRCILVNKQILNNSRSYL
jgi:hypothetical protein